MQRIFFAFALLTLIAACDPDLGECDAASAKTVFYDGLGQPYYGGQALVLATCGGAGGFCHVSSAHGAPRMGVPHGYDFDVGLASSVASTETLADGVSRIRDDARRIWGAVKSGYMPTRDSFFANASGFHTADDQALAALDTEAGKQTLRNWLACNAPVVERTTARPDGIEPVGDVVPAKAVAQPSAWGELYQNVVQGMCAPCHNDESLSGGLDLGSMHTAYTSLVGDGSGGVHPSSGGDCSSAPELVVPGDSSASLLIHKLEGVDAQGDAVCGSTMPLREGSMLLDAAVIAQFRAWIDDGALPEESQ